MVRKDYINVGVVAVFLYENNRYVMNNYLITLKKDNKKNLKERKKKLKV